ncbi:PIN_12 domain-containing protein [Vibrio chagasii]|uniref:PIN domain-containing protein n=1 Tax=Vibrio sp. Makdt TaxID=2998828 RepID=UPI0022CDB528|nr:PIN domain-containing protein [Vibrio sp. Makdt]CAH6972531.1 PIN_12 domain-containing protein [Vibrio chagasii]MDA0151485.1 PIN domain-containing protein [Vibrio sp. Makdt]CAH7315495.1 PIN_12 domain-containing protein [Vibrio chagasii]CAH7409692.1 PIN_12 domain-containing protein [Vibrio chagasii]CAH7419612.1 PIN_12 domain-containing protein [Vibrio chagasii]
MIRILLDTNILHQEGLQSSRFQVLQRLIKSNEVCLFIPEMVLKEYKSKKLDQAESELKKISSALESLNRKSIIDKDKFVVRQFTNFLSSSIKEVNRSVDSWVAENKVVVPLIAETSIEDIFKSYFSGTGAFRNKKQREDIPDAVILDAIAKLAEEGELLVVAKDGALIEAIKDIDNVVLFKDLTEVIDIPQLKETLAELNASERKVTSIIETLSTYDSSYEISEYLTNNYMVEVEGFYGEDFVELPYDLSNISLTEHEVRVVNLNDVSIDSPRYLGNGKFAYALSADCDAELSFYCENDAYESLSYEYRKALSKSEVEGLSDVKVTGSVEVTFKGVVELTGIETDIETSQLQVHLSYLGAEQSHISCDVSLEKLEVQDIY